MKEVSVQTLPKFTDRNCYRMGVAAQSKRDGKPEYNWPEIRKLWLTSSHATVMEFADWIQIPYRTLVVSRHLSVEEKAKLKEQSVEGLRQQIIQSVALTPFAAETQDSFRRTIENANQVAQLAVAYAKSKLVKQIGDKIVPTPSANPLEVKRLVEITEGAVRTLATLMSMADRMKDEREEIMLKKKVKSETKPSP